MTAQNGEAQALVERLYKAFNDSGVMGLGGTDEEGVLAALAEAKDKGLMREVDALYAQTYPDEPRLKAELEDELSDEELARALRLHEEGMSQPPKPKPPAPAKPVVNPVHGTLTPNTGKQALPWPDFWKKYGMGHLFPPIPPTFIPPPPSSSPGKSATPPASSSPSLIPDIGKLLTFETDVDRLHIKIEIPKEASFKYPVHFMKYRILECELNLASADSGKATASIKLIGSPDYTASAKIGISNLDNPQFFAGMVLESAKSTHFEPNKEALKEKINTAFQELKKLHEDYEKSVAGVEPVKPGPFGEPLDRYYEQGKLLGEMAGKIADIYETFDKSRGEGEPEKGPNWNISLGMNLKLDKSGDKAPAEKADTLGITFTAVF